MKDQRGDRPRRVAWRRLAGASCAGGLALGLVSPAAVAADNQLARVSPRLLAVLNANGKQFTRARHGAPRVTKETAVRDAVTSPSRRRGCATGR